MVVCEIGGERDRSQRRGRLELGRRVEAEKEAEERLDSGGRTLIAHPARKHLATKPISASRMKMNGERRDDRANEERESALRGEKRRWQERKRAQRQILRSQSIRESKRRYGQLT